MTIGSAVSDAAAYDNRHKLQHGFGVQLSEIVEAGVAGYESSLKECAIYAGGLEISEGKDSAANASRAYGELIAPLVEEVISVEEPIIAEIRPGFEIAGTPDLIDPIGIGDTKTGKRWEQKSADSSRQLPIYGLLHFARYGRYPRRLWIDNVYETPSSGWKAHRLYTQRNAAQYAGIVEILDRARKGIESGVSLPPPEFGSWYCSMKFCPYYRHCPITKGNPK